MLDYNKIMEDKLIATGLVESVQEGDDPKQDALIISDIHLKNKKKDIDYRIEGEEPCVVMFRDRIDLISHNGSLARFVGKHISFVVEYQEDGIVYVSLRKLLEARREEMIEKLTHGEIVTATISKVKDTCAYLRTDNQTPLILRQKDFSTDWTAIGDVHCVGDKLEVKLADATDDFNPISKTKRIFVQLAKEKYTADGNIDKIKERSIVTGKVVSVQPFGLFVRIEPGIDCLCPVNNYISCNYNDKVVVQINQVNTETRRIRGKIKDKIEGDEYVLNYKDNSEVFELVAD
ncbi:S1 RNA-binding domain-containing protein [[Clostridium] innocuum]|uniref:S1 RNA-binding domain-containing protein n=1 Tax=Clostridium innocuum TaxID=1522 RepID=UPI000D6CA59D|nr:S1 RNA-binding domain-containing protein [[Clostridium] innocuum]MCR0316871.1 S1 RNA-binding domain-containing protein [[Clostridium] innocuum]MCR0369687.1 S1 RNA-binding domain-containing protein [[Clostridium] innocuum]MCR0374801.1 S1 RNA-binding domain-containing protein [[Clostridium] innocuum]MCR0559640.1 S1 RNA-binding domain-containing protein [[Clostridium] innocuum]MCR0602666.1 S1 RNA-binding domain-containing protein [[Clostridium] innocuum]